MATTVVVANDEVVQQIQPPKPRVPKNATENCYYCCKPIIKKNMTTHLKVCKVKQDEVSNPQSLSMLSELRSENQKLKDEIQRNHIENQVLKDVIDKFINRINMQVEPIKSIEP